MSTPGTGGLPQRRPDQQRTYSAPTAAPGAAAGILRVRIIEIIGGTGSGIFIYSGTPAAGNLIGSLVGDTTADPFGNTVLPNGLTIYGAGGQDVFLGLNGSVSQQIFYSGASFEGTAANVSAALAGSGGSEVMELLMSGPKGNAGSGTDWVQIAMESSPESGIEAAALGALNYIDGSGGVHVRAEWGWLGMSAGLTDSLINGINPGPFTLSFGQTAGAAPSGSGTAVADAVAGALNVYMVALASVVTANGDAINDIVNGLDGWGV